MFLEHPEEHLHLDHDDLARVEIRTTCSASTCPTLSKRMAILRPCEHCSALPDDT